MGFCLFEHAQTPGLYFAVNAGQVPEVKEIQDEDRVLCRLVFDHTLDEFEPIVVATRAEVEALLKEAVKIGVNKAELQVLGGQQKVRPTPLLFQNAPHVLLVRELMASELPESDGEFTTASELLMDDGKVRRIVERPGVFSAKVNAAGHVPILNRRKY